MDTDGSSGAAPGVTLYRPHSGDSRLLHLTNVRPLTKDNTKVKIPE